MDDQTKILVFQIGASIATFLSGILGAAIPYMFKRAKNQKAILSYLNCASGGVLLAVSLLHVFPVSGKALNESVNHFDLSYYITFLGMLVMITMTKMSHDHSVHHKHGEEVEKNDGENGVIMRDNSGLQTGLEKSLSQSHLNQIDIATTSKSSNMQAVVLLLIGLMIHDVSEGITVGLMTTMTQSISLFIGIFLHKWCESAVQALCGIREGLTLKKNLMLLIPLSSATPIAQIVSAIIVFCSTHNKIELPHAVAIVQDIFMSFTAGTFIAIVFEEVIEIELTHRTSKRGVLLRLGCLIIGFAIMAIPAIYDWSVLWVNKK